MVAQSVFASAVLFFTCFIASSVAEAPQLEDCKSITVEFLVLDNEATLLALEDDIRQDLEKVGITVTRRLLEKEAYNAAILAGDFDMVFSETWGPPYDPHSFVMAFSNDDEPHATALQGLQEPLTQQVISDKIAQTLTITDEQERTASWAELLSDLHQQAVEVPFSGKRIPAVINKRLSGYQSGVQQFDYPLHKLRIESGSSTVTVSPGAQTGLFSGVGRLDPHTYRPNEFFSNNWVYEGLVEYGRDGRIEPSLATQWTVVDDGPGHRYIFQLRQGVTFHDGAEFNCAVAKLNFDHVFAGPLATPDWHGWYGLPLQLREVTCNSDYELVLTTKEKYYPLLQELTYIRPLRMLSPDKFHGGLSSDPFTDNSCHAGWGTIDADTPVTCKGILGISSTGRWKYEETILGPGDEVQEVVFSRNLDHWSGETTGVTRLRVLAYPDPAAVKAALLDGTLDMVVGDGVLDPEDVAEFRTQRTATFSSYLTESLQNRIIILNTARAPLDDISVRKTIIHAVDKAAIIDKELFGLAEPVSSMFPKTMPYCHIDLTPQWDYDIEKAMLINCPVDQSAEARAEAERQAAEAERQAEAAKQAQEEAERLAAELDDEKGKSKKLSGGAIAGIVVGGVVGVMAMVLAGVIFVKERAGEPVFLPLNRDDARADSAHPTAGPINYKT